MSAATKKSPGTTGTLRVSPEKAVTECVKGISLVEVVASSLDGQEIAASEQIALKAALAALWAAYDFIDQVSDERGGEGGDDPESAL
jgi:hypothetical protein